MVGETERADNERQRFAIGIDLGTSNTVAVIRSPDGRTRPLLFDGQPVLPSVVYLDEAGHIHVGRDAQRMAQLDPARCEPNPKRRIDDQSVLLGDRDVPVVDLLAAILGAVATKAVESVGFLPPAVLTFPATWGPVRREALQRAAARAGWPPVRLVPEPVAAARYFTQVLRRPVPVGSSLAIFDFGGGTLDIAVVRNDGESFSVLGAGGAEDLGGLDVDAALVAHLGQLIARQSPEVWQRLNAPTSPTDRRHRRLFWEDVRGAKEMLSRTTVAPIPVPSVDQAIHLTRDELERLAGPLIDRAVRQTADTINRCGLAPQQLAGVFLVGGASRIPMVARLLHNRLGVAPTVLEQPELPVAEGSLGELAPVGAGVAAGHTGAAAPAGYPGAPVSGGPVSGGPVSGGPVSGGPVSGGGWSSGMPISPAAPGGYGPGVYGAPRGAEAPVPWYKQRHTLIVGAAGLVGVAVLAAAALYFFNPYRERGFEPFKTVGKAISYGVDSPGDQATFISGDTAYLGVDKGESYMITAVALETGKQRWQKEMSGYEEWEGFYVANGVVTVQADSPDSDTNGKIFVRDADNGDELWTRDTHTDDAYLRFVGERALFRDYSASSSDAEDTDLVVGLDPRTGDEKWKPINLDGAGVYYANNWDEQSSPATFSGATFVDPADADTRAVLVTDDGTVKVVDTDTGKVLRTKSKRVNPDDILLVYGGKLFAATADTGYTVRGYDLGSLDKAAVTYTSPDTERKLISEDRGLAICGEKLICVLDQDNGEKTRMVVLDTGSGERKWQDDIPETLSVVPVGNRIVVNRYVDNHAIVDVYADDFGGDKDKTEYSNRSAARVDNSSVLLVGGSASTSVSDTDFFGVGVQSETLRQLGNAKVNASACSWNEKYLVCPGEDGFEIRTFRG